VPWRLAALLLLSALLAVAAGRAQAQPVHYALLPERSHLLVVTGRAGALGFLGHDHAILASDWTAEICYDPDAPSASTADIVVATAELVIDSDRGAELAGLSARPSATTVADLQARMLGPQYLDADAYPELRFEVRTVRSEGDGQLELEGPFTLHGVTRTVRVPASVERLEDGAVRFEARTNLRMSDYDIEPETTLGLVDVADAFDLVVRIEARSRHAPCR
jgi:polyisoprenoid-binding protein YceI